MNRYVIQDLKGYGDDFALLKLRAFFSYLKRVTFFLDDRKYLVEDCTQNLGFFAEFRYTNNWRLGLTWACRKRNPDMIELMIQKGADWCWCGRTPSGHLP